MKPPKPFSFTIRLPSEALELVSSVNSELTQKAKAELDQCWGFYKELQKDGKQRLPNSYKLFQTLPSIQVGKDKYSFSFFRKSLKKQIARIPGSLHIDATANSGIGEYVPEKQVWRALLNLSEGQSRAVKLSTQNPQSASLHERDNLATSNAFDKSLVYTMEIPPRNGEVVSGLAFCASHTLHGGDDSEAGHFLAAYGREVIVA